MCTWNGFVVAAFGGSLSFWTTEGKLLLPVQIRGSKITHLQPWGRVLVTVHQNCTLHFWKIKSKAGTNPTVNDIKFKKVVKSRHEVLCCCIYEYRLCTGGSDGLILLWNCNGKLKSKIKKGPGKEKPITALISCYNGLWAGCSDGTLYEITLREDYFAQIFVSTTIHKDSITSFCKFGKYIASASRDNTVIVWNSLSTTVKRFSCNSTPRLLEWDEKILFAYAEGPELSSFCWENATTGLTSTECMVVSNRKLWQGGKGKIRVYHHGKEWSLERVLWIGFMKNTYPECKLLCVPIPF